MQTNERFPRVIFAVGRLGRGFCPGQAGMIAEPDFNRAVDKITHEVEANTANAQESEVMQVARELGLAPKPNGDHPNHWQARCPETNHSLYITATENSFGCGWCKRKGGIDELRTFVDERKKNRMLKSNKIA